MGKIELAQTAGLDFEAAEIATEVTAALGMRGSGKSNSAAVMAEEMLAHGGIQVIVLDYVGIWFSLRLEPNGTTPSRHRIAILGGKHGDLPLVADAGRVVGAALAAHRTSAVLDVSSFSKGDRCRFAGDFAEALFAGKRDTQGPTWLLLEESQRFVPQKLPPGSEHLARMLGAFEEIAEVGRNFGLGLGLVSQRPQKINKDVLNLADNVLAFRMNGALERAAVRDWVQEKDAADRQLVNDKLPGLERGEALVWSPVRRIYGQWALRKKSTYDAGSTPMQGRAAVKVQPLRPAEIEGLSKALASVVEAVRAADPRAARAEIGRLNDIRMDLVQKLALANARAEQSSQARPYVPQEVSHALAASERAVSAIYGALQMAGRSQDDLRGALRDAALHVGAALTEVKQAQQASHAYAPQGGAPAGKPPTPTLGARTQPSEAGAAGVAFPPESRKRLAEHVERVVRASDQPYGAMTMARQASKREQERQDGGYEPRAGALDILEVIGASHRALSWAQARTMAGMRKGGASDGHRRDLMRHGLVEVSEGGLRATALGKAWLPADSRPHNGAELLEFWCRRLKGSGPAILRVLWEEKGALGRTTILERIGRKKGGATDEAFRDVCNVGLVYRTPDGLCLDPGLFGPQRRRG